MLKSKHYQKKMSQNSYVLRINCCHITYRAIVSVEACENSQHQCPVLDHNHPHTKQAVQRRQVCVWTFDSTFHLCIEMPLNSVLPHVLHSWHSASNWQCHSPQHQHNIKVESSDGSVNYNRKEDMKLISCWKVHEETISVLDHRSKENFQIFQQSTGYICICLPKIQCTLIKAHTFIVSLKWEVGTKLISLLHI